MHKVRIPGCVCPFPVHTPEHVYASAALAMQFSCGVQYSHTQLSGVFHSFFWFPSFRSVIRNLFSSHRSASEGLVRTRSFKRAQPNLTIKKNSLCLQLIYQVVSTDSVTVRNTSENAKGAAKMRMTVLKMRITCKQKSDRNICPLFCFQS